MLGPGAGSGVLPTGCQGPSVFVSSSEKLLACCPCGLAGSAPGSCRRCLLLPPACLVPGSCSPTAPSSLSHVPPGPTGGLAQQASRGGKGHKTQTSPWGRGRGIGSGATGQCLVLSLSLSLSSLRLSTSVCPCSSVLVCLCPSLHVGLSIPRLPPPSLTPPSLQTQWLHRPRPTRGLLWFGCDLPPFWPPEPLRGQGQGQGCCPPCSEVF